MDSKQILNHGRILWIFQNKNILYKRYCICNSPRVGRKISFEKSATAFSVKLGRKTTEVIQEFDAFVSNIDVDPRR